jgi:hypothetical protein
MTVARRAFVGVAAAALVLTSHAIALADNTNDNSNTNNNSDVGGYLDTGSGADESKGWPPTKSDWPPSDISTGGLVDESDKAGDGKPKAAPIVSPAGQAPAAAGDESQDGGGTSTTPTPIVPAAG